MAYIMLLTEINIAQAMQQLTLRIILKGLFSLDSPSQPIKLGNAFTALISVPSRRLGLLGRLQMKLPFSSLELAHAFVLACPLPS